MAAAKNISALLLSVIVIGLLAVGGYVTFQDMSGPEVTLSPATDRVSPKLDMVLDLKDAKSGIRAVTVTVKKNSNTYVVFEKHFPDVQFHQRVTFNLKDAGLREGAFELEIKASDASLAGFGKGNTTTRRMEMRMDSLPPRISVKTMPPYVRRGGVGTIAYTVSEDVRTSGVKVGDLFFPGFRQPNGDYYCFFAFPHFLTVQQYAPDIMAEDMAGNVTSSRLAFRPIDKQFRHDNIPLSDNFLNSKMPDFQADFPDATSMLDLFLKVNSVMRKSNEEKLLEVGRNTASSMLWKGEFLRLPNSANRAGFADHRSYIYGGRVVDEQTHLGLDLASLAMAPIPAANSGRVVFAGNLGIYGQLVIVDHGLGLMSLYSHMSEIAVNVGTEVKKGDILGRTGTTGMAGGDHLHFGMLVSGVQVQPIEWLDSHRIKDNVIDRLEPKAQ